MARDWNSEETLAIRKQALEAQNYRRDVARVAVSIVDKVIYEHPDTEVRSFEHLQSIVDANEYLIDASKEFGFDLQDFEFMNDVTAKFDELIKLEVR